MKVVAHITIEMTQPVIDGTAWDAIRKWVNDNVTTKVPSNATQAVNYTVQE